MGQRHHSRIKILEAILSAAAFLSFFLFLNLLFKEGSRDSYNHGNRMRQVWLCSGLEAHFPQWEGEKLGLGKMNGRELGLLRHGLQRTHSPSLHQSGPPIEGPSLSLVSDLQPFMSPERNFSSTWVTQACDAASSRNGPTIKSRFSSFFDSWSGLARLGGRSIPEEVFSCLCPPFGWFGQV